MYDFQIGAFARTLRQGTFKKISGIQKKKYICLRNPLLRPPIKLPLIIHQRLQVSPTRRAGRIALLFIDPFYLRFCLILCTYKHMDGGDGWMNK